MTVTLIPIVAAIIGLLLWILPLPAKAQEAGRILFFVGIFWFVGAHARTGEISIR